MLSSVGEGKSLPLTNAESDKSDKGVTETIHQLSAIKNCSSSQLSHREERALEGTPEKSHSPQAEIESTLMEKQALYSDYLEYGYNPVDIKVSLLELENILSDIPSQYIHHAEKVSAALSDMKFLVSQMLTPEMRGKLTKVQLDRANKREAVVRELISAFARLPNMWRKTTIDQQLSANVAAKEALTNELVESTLQRMLAGNSSEEDRELLEGKIRQVLLAEPQTMPIRLREWHDCFMASSLAKIAEPVKEELQAGLRKLNATAKTAQQLAEYDTGIYKTGFGHALRRLADVLEQLESELQKNIPAHHEQIRKPGENRASSVADKLDSVSHQTGKILSELHGKINHEKLKPFPDISLTSFHTLSPEKKEQCLALKEKSTPVHDNAIRLKKATAQLAQAIREAGRDGVSTLPGSVTPEDAVLTELMVLTGDTPETRLIQAIDTARAVAQKVLNEPTVASSASGINTDTFSCLIQETSDSLASVAASLLDITRLAEANCRQKDLVSTTEAVKKRTKDIISTLNDGLEYVTGVKRHEDFGWLSGIWTTILNQLNEISSLTKNGRRTYVATQDKQGHNSEPGREIHLAVLPLLNEVEKIQMAGRQLGMALSTLDKDQPSVLSTLERAGEICSHINLNAILAYKKTLNQLLRNQDITVLEYSGEPVKLSELLNSLTDVLMAAAKALHTTALNVRWDPKGKRSRLELTILKKSLNKIKARIKDAVEVSTGIRPHNNTPEGMIAKDAGEWLASQRRTLTGVSQQEMDDITEEIIQRLSQQFISESDPEGKLFRVRAELAMRDAEKEMIPWPQTAEEHLSATKTPKEYTLAWAEKRLTYGLIYNLMVYHSPAGMFSLYKRSLASPLRLVNFLLTPVRMEKTKRAMEKVKPGETYPAEIIDEYKRREMFQTIFRLVSMLSPQLPKTLAATLITSYGLIKGGEYREAFLKRAISRLPQDLFWASLFTGWNRGMTAWNHHNTAATAETAATVEDDIALAKLQALLHGLQTERGETEEDHQLAGLSEGAKGSPPEETEALVNKERVKRAALSTSQHIEKGENKASAQVSIARKGRENLYNRVLDNVKESNPYIKESLKFKAEREKNKLLNKPEKTYSLKEARQKLLDAMHDYKYVDTGSKIINFHIINPCTDENSFNADGSINTVYLRETDDFKSLIKNEIMPHFNNAVASEDFNQYMDRLIGQIASREDTKKKINDKVYIKVPSALAMMYSTMLNHIRRYDKDSYYDGFREQDIAKFITLKSTQGNLRNYVLNHFDKKIGEQVKRIDDYEYHSASLDQKGKDKLLDHMTQPYLDKKSTCYIKLKEEINKNSDCTPQYIIALVYKKVIQELNETINLPLPFFDNNSLSGEYINKLTQVLNNAQSVFGGLYSTDAKGNINSSLANNVRSEIKSLYSKMNRVGGSRQYQDEINKFAENKISGKKTGAKQPVNHTGKINLEDPKVVEKHRQLLNNHFDSYLIKIKNSDRITGQSLTANKDGAFIAEMQRMIGEELKASPSSTNQNYAVLDDFCQGKLSKSEFNLHRNTILDFYIREVVNASFAEDRQRAKFSVIFLSKITGIDFAKIDSVSEDELVNSGTFLKMKRKSLGLYDKRIIQEIDIGMKILLQQDLNKFPRVLAGLKKRKISIFSQQERKSFDKILGVEEYDLALDFDFAKFKKGEDIKSFSERIVYDRIKFLEKKKLRIEKQLYKVGLDNRIFNDRINKLRRINVRLLDLRNEIKERCETINYADSIASRCHVVNGKYSSPYIPDQPSKYGTVNVENAKIAAVRHLYKMDSSANDEKTRLEYLNVYNALVASGTPEAYHVQNLASLYWAIFYHPTFKGKVKSILTYVDSSRESGKRKNFDSIQSNRAVSQQIKLFSSYASTSRFRHLFYEYQKKMAFDEKTRRGETLRGTYFSITDIKKRSEIPGHSLSAFSEQFTKKYTAGNMDKDVLLISGARFRESGIDLRQLDLPPKKVYTYKHLSRLSQQGGIVRDRTRELPRNDDVMIVVTQNNSVLVSVIYGDQKSVHYIPPGEKEPKLGQIDAVVKDLAPYALEYYGVNRKGPDSLAKDRQDVISGIDTFYQMDGTFNYSFKGDDTESKYLILDSNTLRLSEKDKDIYSWGRKDLLVLEKTKGAVPMNDSVEKILHRQVKNSLKEEIEVMKEVYNDTEDTLGNIINYTPVPLTSFASAARKMVNHIPLNDGDIGAMIIDVFSVGDSAFKGMTLIRKTKLVNAIRSEISKVGSIEKDLVKLEGKIKSAVHVGIKSFTAEHGLSTFFKGSELVKPAAEQIEYNFHDLQFNSLSKTFYST